MSAAFLSCVLLLTLAPPGDRAAPPADASGVAGDPAAARVLWAARSDTPWDGFGAEALALGDVDGDGALEVAVSSVGAARVDVLSGKDGARRYTLRGAPGFGLALAAGDFDGDDRPELAVGGSRRPGARGASRGAVTVHEGESGLRVAEHLGDGAGHDFGEALVSLGDVDADGRDDLLVGAEPTPRQLLSGSTVRAGAGRWGARPADLLPAPRLPEALADEPAGTLVRLGDVDGDGLADWGRAAATAAEGAPALLVLSGRPDAPRELRGAAADDGFGWSLADAGDVDGDGFDDVVVGAPGDDGLAPDGGAVHVLSGRTGETLLVLRGAVPDGRLGSAVGSAGDVDGDGRADVFATSRDGAHGVVRVFTTAPDVALPAADARS